MSFTAMLVDKAEDGSISQSIETLDDSRLPDGNVTVAVEYSAVNYKDGLCLTGKGGLVRQYPHVPGVDFAGTVELSSDPRYRPGDKVILTGWRVGEIWWGGYATRARLKADWLVPMPSALSTRQAAAIGTAGLTATLAIMTLEAHGLTPAGGEVLVTGAAGGVGSMAVALLARRGYQVAAVTGRPETASYLTSLGAALIFDRQEFAETTAKPLESERWAGVIDNVGGDILGRALKQVRRNGSVAAIGLAAGAAVPSFAITPFLLRGINLLGIDSVMQPYEKRVEAWKRLAEDLPPDLTESMISDYALEDLPALAAEILKGQVRGRAVVDVSSAQHGK